MWRKPTQFISDWLNEEFMKLKTNILCTQSVRKDVRNWVWCKWDQMRSGVYFRFIFSRSQRYVKNWLQYYFIFVNFSCKRTNDPINCGRQGIDYCHSSFDNNLFVNGSLAELLNLLLRQSIDTVSLVTI